MNFKGFSIPQLIALREILISKNLTKSALKCHSTQPGMSLILKKARHLTHDDLLIYSKKKGYITRKGKEILDILNRLFITLNELNDLNQTDRWKNYKIFDKHYTIACPAYLETTITVFFMGIINSQNSSKINFEFISLNHRPDLDEFESKQIDLFIGYTFKNDELPEGLSSKTVKAKDKMGYAVKKGITSSPYNLNCYLKLPHITYSQRISNKSLSTKYDDFLNSQGHYRNVIGLVSNIFIAFEVQQALSTPLINTAPQFILDIYKKSYAIDCYDVPIDDFYLNLDLVWADINSDALLTSGLIEDIFQFFKKKI